MVKATQYLILIDLKYDDKILLVHGLYGYMDILEKKYLYLIERWKKGSFQCESEEESKVFELFRKHKFISEAEEEESFRRKLTSELLEKHKQIINEPRSATFIPSYRCNFACPYCFENGVNRKSPIMTREQVDAAFSLFADGQLQHMNLYGGEPLLPEHKSIVSYILKKAPSGVEHTVVTNGYYLLDFLPLFTSLKMTHIQITLDGPKEVHDQTRILLNGSGSYDKIHFAIGEALKANIPIKVRMNLSKENYEACYELKKQLKKEFNHTSLLTFDMQELFQYNSDKKTPIAKVMVEDALENHDNRQFEGLPGLARFFYNRKPVQPHLWGCTSGIANRLFDPYGDLYSCYLGVGNAKKRIGKYYPKLVFEKENLLTRVAVDIEACTECKYLFLCGGGCPNPIIDSGESIHNPNCVMMEYAVDHLIPLLYHQNQLRAAQTS